MSEIYMKGREPRSHTTTSKALTARAQLNKTFRTREICDSGVSWRNFEVKQHGVEDRPAHISDWQGGGLTTISTYGNKVHEPNAYGQIPLELHEVGAIIPRINPFTTPPDLLHCLGIFKKDKIMVTRAEKIAWLTRFPAANYPEENHLEDCDTVPLMITSERVGFQAVTINLPTCKILQSNLYCCGFRLHMGRNLHEPLKITPMGYTSKEKRSVNTYDLSIEDLVFGNDTNFTQGVMRLIVLMLANPGSSRAPISEEWPLTMEGAEALLKQFRGRENRTETYYATKGKANQQEKIGNQEQRNKDMVREAAATLPEFLESEAEQRAWTTILEASRRSERDQRLVEQFSSLTRGRPKEKRKLIVGTPAAIRARREDLAEKQSKRNMNPFVKLENNAQEYLRPTRKREKRDYRRQDLPSNDRGDTSLEAHKTKKESRIVELSDDESGIPEEVVRENIPQKQPKKNKSVAQNLKERNTVQPPASMLLKMQEQDRQPSATQSAAPKDKAPVTTDPETFQARDPDKDNDDPKELQLSGDSEDEKALTAEQKEGLSLAEEVINDSSDEWGDGSHQPEMKVKIEPDVSFGSDITHSETLSELIGSGCSSDSEPEYEEYVPG